MDRIGGRCSSRRRTPRPWRPNELGVQPLGTPLYPRDVPPCSQAAWAGSGAAEVIIFYLLSILPILSRSGRSRRVQIGAQIGARIGFQVDRSAINGSIRDARRAGT